MSELNRNLEVAEMLKKFGKYYSASDERFRAMAYRNAAMTISNLREGVEEYSEEKLATLPAIGKSISSKIIEYLKTGKSKNLEQLKNIVAKDSVRAELLDIEGFGGSTIDALYNVFHFKSIDEVEFLLASGAAKLIPGFKEKKIQKLLDAIKEHKTGGTRRNIPIQEAIQTALEIYVKFKDNIGVENIAIAGSIRRLKATVNDVDILISENDYGIGKAMLVSFISMKRVKRVLAKGDSLAIVVLDNGIQADMRIVKSNEFYTALQYFTGSKEFNIQLRKIAIKKGYKLSEKGLFIRDTEIRIPINSEEDIFRILNVKYVKPNER